YSIERALSPKIDPGAAFGWMNVTDIAGLDAYRSGKAADVSGIRVAGDRLSITLVKPAPDFPARISLPFFSAVPLGTPALWHGGEEGRAGLLLPTGGLRPVHPVHHHIRAAARREHPPGDQLRPRPQGPCRSDRRVAVRLDPAAGGPRFRRCTDATCGSSSSAG